MREDMLVSILSELNGSASDIQASAVISTDGLMIANVMPSIYDEERVGAMSAALLALGERTANELDRGELEQVIVKGQDGYVIMVYAGHGVVLSVMTKSDAKLGLVMLDACRAANRIPKVL